MSCLGPRGQRTGGCLSCRVSAPSQPLYPHLPPPSLPPTSQSITPGCCLVFPRTLRMHQKEWQGTKSLQEANQSCFPSATSRGPALWPQDSCTSLLISLQVLLSPPSSAQSIIPRHHSVLGRALSRGLRGPSLLTREIHTLQPRI